MPQPLVPGHLREHPFTLEQAIDAGLSRSALRSRPWVRVFRNVYVHVDVPDNRSTRLYATKLVVSYHMVTCGLTAAWIHDVDVRRETDLDVHAGFPKGKRPRSRPGVVVCQETLDEADICEIDGVRVTTPLRTAFDCLRWLRDPEGIVVADALTHSHLTNVTELSDYFAAQRRLRNLRIGEGRLIDVDPLSESPMESRLRVQMLRAGLPRPESQINVFDESGRFVARVDLGYREQRTAVEYDGAHHWIRRREDDRRRDALRALGWDVIVVSAADLSGNFDAIVAAIWRSLHRHHAAA